MKHTFCDHTPHPFTVFSAVNMLFMLCNLMVRELVGSFCYGLPNPAGLSLFAIGIHQKLAFTRKYVGSITADVPEVVR